MRVVDDVGLVAHRTRESNACSPSRRAPSSEHASRQAIIGATIPFDEDARRRASASPSSPISCDYVLLSPIT
jgi:hypothetical protein